MGRRSPAPKAASKAVAADVAADPASDKAPDADEADETENEVRVALINPSTQTSVQGRELLSPFAEGCSADVRRSTSNVMGRRLV